MKARILATLLVLSVLSPLALAAPTSATQSECSTTVTYDEFRTDNTTVDAAANDSATIEKQNTLVRVEQATGFIRIDAENPNGYCVQFEVQIDDRVVGPAELGDVDSNNDSVTAEWHAIRDFEADETYTSVEFTLEPGEQATFAASDLRVKSLSWTGTVTSTGGSWFDQLTNFSIGSDDEPLQKRQYTFSAENNSTYVTISLQNESTGRSVDDWQAMYRTPSNDWTPISTDSTEPVFYRKVGDQNIQFVFNDPDAEVRFTANPTWRDDLGWQLDSYSSGWDSLFDLNPFGDDEEDS